MPLATRIPGARECDEMEPRAVPSHRIPLYPRLTQVKEMYDLTNFFSISQNVQPAAYLAGAAFNG